MSYQKNASGFLKAIANYILPAAAGAGIAGTTGSIIGYSPKEMGLSMALGAGGGALAGRSKQRAMDQMRLLGQTPNIADHMDAFKQKFLPTFAATETLPVGIHGLKMLDANSQSGRTVDTAAAAKLNAETAALAPKPPAPSAPSGFKDPDFALKASIAAGIGIPAAVALWQFSRAAGRVGSGKNIRAFTTTSMRNRPGPGPDFTVGLSSIKEPVSMYLHGAKKKKEEEPGQFKVASYSLASERLV